MGRRRPFTPDGSGRVRLQLPKVERELLRQLPGQALDLIDDRHPSSRRLFPAAYPQDEQAEAEYRRSTGAELLAARRHALQTMADTVDRPSLELAELEQWLAALESLRLVLGTRLDVVEDMAEPSADDPRAPAFALYHYLSLLQEEAVDVLAATLPEVPEDDPLERLAAEHPYGLPAAEHPYGLPAAEHPYGLPEDPWPGDDGGDGPVPGAGRGPAEPPGGGGRR